MHNGMPVDLSDRPAGLGRSLGTPFYKDGRNLFNVFQDKMCIYSLEKQPINPNEDEQTSFAPETQSATKSESSTPVAPLVHWVACANGEVPRQGAVYVGKDVDRGPLYVGRAYILGCLLPGKVAVHHRVCYVAYEGREYAFRKYEVLVVERGRERWVQCIDGYCPPNALPCGYTVRGDTVYSARAPVGGILTPGHFMAGDNVCRISYNVEEFLKSDYQILTIVVSNNGEDNTKNNSAQSSEDENSDDENSDDDDENYEEEVNEDVDYEDEVDENVEYLNLCTR